MSIQSAVSKGDILRTEFPQKNQLPLYLGSGSCGGCFDGYGFMNEELVSLHSSGNDAPSLKHSEHYCHGRYGLDAWVSVYRLKLAALPQIISDAYRQELSLYQGRLTSQYVLTDGNRVTVRNYFNPYFRDVLAVELELSADGFPMLAVEPCKEVYGVYDQKWNLPIIAEENGFLIDTGAVKTSVSIRCIAEEGNCVFSHSESGGVSLSFTKGKFLLLIGTAKASRMASVWENMQEITAIEDYRRQCEQAWAKRYGESYIDLPDDYTAKMWARSLYYVLCSFSPDGIPSAPMGWAGYNWRFHFPQDISYIHPALLRLGHIDLAKGIVEFYRRNLDTMRENTRRIYGGKGVMWAWEFPIHGTPDLLTEEAPNVYQFEIHNASYPARMAYETAQQLHDDQWFKQVALPIIKESAAFYGSHMVKEPSGKWSLAVTPSMSQDEFADADSKNYLCALYAARYTFLIAQKCGIPDYNIYLEEGLSFDRLYDAKENLYRTSEQMTAEQWGQEKHPVQLNPLVFLPVSPLSDIEKNAYTRRADICEATKKDRYLGWTLATFWLSASHIQDGEALYRELHRASDATYNGVEQLEFHESSTSRDYIDSYAPYYVTTHGFFLQAVCDAFVSDYFGETVLEGAVPQAWKGASYHCLHTKNEVFSGTVK